jgi:hypothetical protein
MSIRKLLNHGLFHGFLTATLAIGLLSGVFVAQAAAAGKSGTTLAAVKTLEICEVSPATDTALAVWRYYGEIAIWNQGAVITQGLAIDDEIQTKCGSGQFANLYQVPQANFTPAPHNAVAGTTQVTADLYTYFVDANAVPGCDIRNVANITITNHSGQTGAFGPSPKSTWTGGTPPPCELPTGGCVYTQGYWGNKPDVVWPSPYDRNAAFYLSLQTWQQVLDTPVNVSQGYYQLAHPYIAAVLNVENGAPVPSGLLQDVLNQADNWLTNNGPSACTANGSCGTQKDWAKILDSYNNGLYPGGPVHCGDE